MSKGDREEREGKGRWKGEMGRWVNGGDITEPRLEWTLLVLRDGSLTQLTREEGDALHGEPGL